MKANIFILLLAALCVMSFRVTLSEQDKKGVATVQKIDGFEVYIMCEPAREYTVVGDMSVYDAGISQQYIADWTKKYVKKAISLVEKGSAVDAILYKEGKTALAIKFK